MGTDTPTGIPRKVGPTHR